MKAIKRIIVCLIIIGAGLYAFVKLYTPPAYDFNRAMENGDVVTRGKDQYNVEKLDKFVENFKNGKKDIIVITAYTEEGNAIIYRIEYDGKEIKHTSDTSRDKFSSNRSLLKRTTKFDNIQVNDTTRYTQYNLVKGDRVEIMFTRFKKLS